MNIKIIDLVSEINYKKYAVYIAVVFLQYIFVNNVSGQSSHSLLLEGDDLFKKEQYELAEEKYRKAVAKDKTGKARYNLGNTLANQERLDEALNQYQSALMSDDPNVVSSAYYNLGNTYLKNNKIKEGIDAYKNSLRYNPEDVETKENLMLAKQMLRQMQQQQQQQQQDQNENQDQDQENQDQQEQQQQQDQQQSDEEKDEEQKDQQNQSESQNEEEQKEQQAEQSDKKDLDKEDARKLLEIIENEEQKVQEKLRKMKGNSKKPKKDW